MADDPNKRGRQDRSKVAGDQDYEVQYLARAHGLTPEQARELIARVGDDCAKLDQEAHKMKQRRSS